jgi:RNA polymerase sigma-70 factor (ECF subfamily)
MKDPSGIPDISDSLRASAGEGWDALYAESLPRIYNYFRFRVGPYEDIEELTARTFEKAWRSRRGYRQDLAAFSTWLYAIARNVATDHLRQRSLQIQMRPLLGQEQPVTPLEEAERRSNAARLAKLVAALGEHHREILALKYGAALTNRRIAVIVGISESNVGTTVQRIVEKLRALW